MKCPKCGYLGFETGDRCRNCGYDFSLVTAVEPDLALRSGDDRAAPLADLALGDVEPFEPGATERGLDLDRLIGAVVVPEGPPTVFPPEADVRLPLFDAGDVDDAPLIQAAGPPRAPLAVRRPTTEAPRARSRTTRPFRRETPALDLEPASADDGSLVRPPVYVRPGGELDVDAASGAARLMAFAIDVALLAAVNAAVVYLTLQIAGVGTDEVDVLPLGPLAAFLALLSGGYLVALTAASGQTIGKMAAGIRVVAEDAGRLDTGRALLRAAASVLSIATLGAGFVPALLSPGGRTIHDRIAGTRVVRA